MLLFSIPPFAKAWIFFSLVIGILLLLQIEGAAELTWLIPLITLMFCLENTRFGKDPIDPVDRSLFPTERQLIQQNPHPSGLPMSISEQKEQLNQGWQNYLVTQWAKEDPSELPEVFAQQVEKGAYQFHLTRLLKKIDPSRTPLRIAPFQTRFNLIVLGVICCWNFVFAIWITWLKRRVYSCV